MNGSSLTQQGASSGALLAPGMFPRVLSLAERIVGSRKLLYPLFTLLFLAPTLYLASIKLFWDDEFFTLYLSTTPTWNSLLDAMYTGADQHPPSFYWLTHWILGVAGGTHVGLRVTAMAGFWLLCVCLYEIVGKLTTPLLGMGAMIFPLAANFYEYAYEGRGYGLVIGFSALAFLAWIRATEGIRRPLWLAVLAFSLAASVGSHYYAVLAAVPLGVGELVRSWRRRRIDWLIWLSFAATALPLLAFFPVIQSARGFSTHFWAVPVWQKAWLFYGRQLGLGMVGLLASFAIAILLERGAASTPRVEMEPARGRLPAWISTAVWSYCFLPVLTMIVAKLVTHGYADRYALAAVVGLIVLFFWMLFLVAPRNATVATAVVAVCLLLYGKQVLRFRQNHRNLLADIRKDYRLLKGRGNGPIVFSEVTIFHRLSFYAKPEFARRLVYASDPEASIRHLRHDTIDRGLLALNPWFPLNVRHLHSFVADYPNFLNYGYVGSWTWLTFELPKVARTSALLDRRGERILMWTEGAASYLTPAEFNKIRAEEQKMKFRALPWTGRPLCESYLKKAACPAI